MKVGKPKKKGESEPIPHKIALMDQGIGKVNWPQEERHMTPVWN